MGERHEWQEQFDLHFWWWMMDVDMYVDGQDMDVDGLDMDVDGLRTAGGYTSLGKLKSCG